MKTDLPNQLDDLKAIWMIGGAASVKSPPDWRDCTDQDTQPELALLAIAGQAIQFAMQPMPGSKLSIGQLLPRLRLPPPPQPARMQFNNLLRVTKLDESQLIGIIQLLAARGYTVSPIDYLPKNYSKLPEVYAPWDSWSRNDQTALEASQETSIDSSNWNLYSPSERRLVLSELRGTQPELARQLILENAPSLPADERMRIIELLNVGLCIEDQSLLESFAKDRSSKVQHSVQKMLARLGLAQDLDQEVAEFADFFSVNRQLLSRTPSISAKPLKTDAQRKRREELSTSLSLQSLVKGLGLTSEEELIGGWQHDIQASDILVRMVAATGSEQAAACLASRVPTLKGISVEAFQILFSRLGRASRLELLPRVLKNDDASFVAALTCCQGVLGELTWELLEGLPALERLKKLCIDGSSLGPVEQITLRQGLYSLGLLVDQETAGRLLQELTQENMFSSDPMLGILKLNQCLPPGEIS